MSAWYALSAAFGVGAAVLLVHGLRGRRTDDHPICRRCGFDLWGKPAESHRCSECGRDLNERSAIRVGNRSFHWPFILACIPLAFFSMLSLACVHWHPQYDPEGHKTNATLINELDSTELHSLASVELGNRLASGRLSQAEGDAISERALREQANPSIPWDGTWEGWLEYAQDSQRLSSSQWDRYALHTLRFQLAVRPVVGRGGPLPMRISWTPTGRGRCFGPVSFKGRIDLGHGIVVPINHVAGAEDAGEATFLVNGAGLAELPAGLQVASVALNLSMPQVSTRGRFLYGSPGVNATPALNLSGRWFLSSSALTSHMVHSRDVERIDRQAIEVTAVDTIKPAPMSRTFSKTEFWTISATDPAVSIACRILVRSGDKETELGDFAARAGQSTSKQFEVTPGSVGTETATVILRPSAEVAAEQVALPGNVWGDEIVVRDVPIRQR